MLLWKLVQSDDFNDDGESEEVAARNKDMDSESRNRLEHELGQAEASVLRLRAELGYSLTNHLTGTSTRLEKIARVPLEKLVVIF